MTPTEQLEQIRRKRGNVLKACSRCNQNFEVPESYPLEPDWQCSYCSRGGPLCEHVSVAFLKCEQCGCILR